MQTHYLFKPLLWAVLLFLPVLGWGQQTGELDATFNPGTGAVGGNNEIRTIAKQADGKIIIGGSFISYNGIARNYIARLNSDGSLDATFNPGTGPNYNVYTTAIQTDGKIIIGGNFTSYNGTARNYIARLNADGSLDATFNPGTGANNVIWTTALQANGKIIIGGNFTSYNGTARNYIACLNADGSLDATFNPGTGASSYVNTTLLQPDGKIIIGGNFTSYNGTARNYIARLNADGSLDATFNPGIGANNFIFRTAVQADGKIIIGGNFTSYNGTARNYITRLNADGSLDATFNPGTGANNYVYTTALQADGKIIIGGDFTSYNGIARNRIARLNADGSLDATFNPGTGANQYVFTTALQSDGKIIIGGGFTTFNGTSTNHIARILGVGNCTNPPNPTISGIATFCSGGSTVLTSSASTGNIWSNGATTQSITVTSVGSYSVRVISGNCTSAESSTLVSVTTNSQPNINGTNIICPGETTSLTSSIEATSYLWSNGLTTQSISVNAPGTYTVRNIIDNCTSLASSSVAVTYCVPNITSFSPSTAFVGGTVNIFGSNFTRATAVRFNGLAAGSFQVVSASLITAVVPDGVTTGTISVVSAGGTSVSAGSFTPLQGPLIASIAPTSGPIGTVVTITGSNFNNVTSIGFAGLTSTNFSVRSPSQINFTIPSGGFTGPLIVNTSNAGSITSSQSFTTTGFTTLIAGTVTGIPSLQVVVPITARGFQNLIGFQGSINFDSKLTYVGVEQLNGTLVLTTTNFGLSQVASNTIFFAWNQSNNTAQTLNDNSVLFAIRFTVSSLTVPGASLPVTFSPLEVVKSDFTIQSSNTIAGAVNTFPATISGRITKDGSGVKNVSFNVFGPCYGCYTNTNRTDGSYSLNPAAYGNYTISPRKLNDGLNGITVSDIALIQRHILNTALFGDAYKVIAADVDRSNSVTVADVAFVRDMILRSRTMYPQSRLWTFVRSDQTFTNQNSPWPIDTMRTYTSLPTTNTAQDFIGCKLGDVNSTWDYLYARIASTTLGLQIHASQNNATRNYQLPVRTSISNTMAVQFTMKWPSNRLGYVGIENLAAGVTTARLNDSIVTVTAINPNGNMIPAGTTLFTLNLQPISSLQSDSALVTINSDVTPAIAYDSLLNEMSLEITPAIIPASGVLGNKTKNLPTFQLFPNPATGKVTVKTNGIGTIQILDLVGKVVLTQPATGIDELNISKLATGVYTVKVGNSTQKLVVK